MTNAVNPLHPDIIPRLDPEFAAYYNNHSAHQLGPHQIPWDPAIRKDPPVAGASKPLKVGQVKDFSLSKCLIRVFWPTSPHPQGGYPVFLYFHGGGWTLGNINTENHFSSIMCLKADCVVVSVDYRLGPEDPYPAAVEDAEEALQWIIGHADELNADTSRIAVGGSSSGGNLAAIIAHKAAVSEPPIQLVFQVLVVPVIDNTASTSGLYTSWTENKNTAALTPAKMLWFRENYSPNPNDWTKWDNSPIFAPEGSFKKVPDAWIGVAELDILRDEGVAYGEKLKAAGRKVELKIYKGSPHPIMAMDALSPCIGKKVLQSGRDLIADAANALTKAFHTKLEKE